MVASETCKNALLALESYLRDDHNNSEAVKSAADSILLVEGRKPSPLEEVELLDTLATYVMVRGEEDLKYRLFFELFPVDKDISTECLCFITKLSSLALCLGLSPVLELISLWLKIRVSQFYSSIVQSSNNSSQPFEIIETFVTSIISDLLSIRGLFFSSAPSVCINDTTQNENLNTDHPLYNIPLISPIFADAFLSGITLVYGFRPSSRSSVHSSSVSHETSKIPPPQVIFCITHWLRLARIPKQLHQPGINTPSNWTSIDWTNLTRRYKPFNQPRFSIDQILMCQPPPPICLSWWTIFEPLWHIMRYPDDSTDINNRKLVSNYIADLHHELLQCLSEPSSLVAYRHGCGASGGSGFQTWLLTCSRKMELTKEFYYLELMVSQVHEQYNLICSLPERDSSDKHMDFLELMIIRLAEFMQICWVSGRIRNLSSDEFHRLLTPLERHNWIDLVLTRFKR